MPELVVTSYNIHKGLGTDLRRDPARTVAVLAEIRADLVALQEADRRFGDRRGVLDQALVRLRTGLVALDLPDRLGVQAQGWHGNMILLRPEFRVDSVRALSLPGLEPRGAILLDLTAYGQPLRVVSAHLGLLHQSRLAQARMLAAEIAGGDGRPVLVMGDFNEWRLGADCGLMPLRRELRAVKRSAATQASFPAPRPILPLDRIIGCPRAGLGAVRVHDSALARRASDHLPVCATLRLPKPQSTAI
jgi:endonuclease/exonuclease/phosphatase family metal-dependent hydrolase